MMKMKLEDMLTCLDSIKIFLESVRIYSHQS